MSEKIERSAAIGIMEQWNDGIMGSGILEWWVRESKRI
jgi:hypothetical protein